MGIYDGLYSVLNYPVLSVIDLTKKVGSGIFNISGLNKEQIADVKLPANLQNLDVSKLVKTSNPILRIAAVSGVLAIILGTYEAHVLQKEEDFKERRTIFETANKYHFIHTLAMSCVPLSKYPKTAASFMAIGIILFSGTCYYHALTGKSNLKKFTPLGGISLILGWLSMVL